ncbi:MAG: helix-turn-helix transcriptional regulator [Clostridia bacterium]|nr:helix-turn-helix transcriptional regulator [Clostridia bacterium]
MEDIRNLIGNRIRILRKKLKLSQEALAFKAGLDRTYIASIESGKRNVSIVNIERIAIALECSLYTFFNAKEFKNHKIYMNNAENLANVAENDNRKYH